MPPWEHFFHVADIGVRGIGSTLEEAFENTALAMTAVIVEPDRVAGKKQISLRVTAADRELLLTEWLNALIYEMAYRHMLFRRFQVEIEGLTLHGRAWGESVDEVKHRPAVEVKGATFTQLKVYKTASGSWIAQCVVDV